MMLPPIALAALIFCLLELGFILATSFGGPDSPRATAPWLPSVDHGDCSDGDRTRYELDPTYGLPKRFAFPEAKIQFRSEP
jgi:hypothetical protein